MNENTGPNDPDEPDAPYRPPPIEEHESVARAPLVVRAVVAGVLIDWVATYATMILIQVMAGAVAVSRYSTASQVEEYLEKLFQSPDFVILTSLVGLACVALGGFASGMLARHDAVRHALFMGVLSVAIGLSLEISSVEEVPAGWMPLWFRWLRHLFVVPAAVFGGYAAAASSEAPDPSG